MSEPTPPPAPRSQGAVGPGTFERFGAQMRHFPVAVSSEAMAQAWANTESGPHGAVVTVDHEIGARGFRGAIWGAAPADTLTASVILRPTLSAEEGNLGWLVAALIAAEGAEAVTGRSFSTWWPQAVIDGSAGPEHDLVAAIKAEVALGPGQVKNLIATVRFDLARLGLDRDRRDDLLEAVVGAVGRVSERLDEGPQVVAAAYEQRCAVVGQRVKVRLRPKGETRGTARAVDRAARLEIVSPSGMVERIGIDQLRDLSVV